MNSVAVIDEQGRQIGIVLQTATSFDTPQLMTELVDHREQQGKLLPCTPEGHLLRSRGRTGRDRVVSSRATADEHQELEAAAKAEGKALSEWTREVLLREARSPRLNALFTEVVATRMLLNLLLKSIACGKQITDEEFSGVLTDVRTGKA